MDDTVSTYVETKGFLTHATPCISENCIKIKIKAPQRSVKTKFKVNFFSSSRMGTGRVNSYSRRVTLF